ncbi:hypothetical protein EYZ11_009608 [Aspergillus tanneri]|uniref:Uncharacterized protein n=1 Tax=Aspergillus tanneri TaxID=1220188 RepID=A0A4S3J7I1_9EURO|nr:hypothetical protein EYZ11_009608 [Aspergillus tanneri]
MYIWEWNTAMFSFFYVGRLTRPGKLCCG